MAQNVIPLGDLDEVVAFTNLRELSTTFDGLIGEDPDEELPSTLVEFIRGARNIKSLCLSFEEDDQKGAAPGESIELFLELASDHFPNLRRLEIHSQHLVPIDNYSGPEFRQFIQNHNQLQKILLLTGGYDYGVTFINPPPLTITPRDMGEMMPSIRHFAGPGVLIGSLLRSGLAKQIELLEFHEPAIAGFGYLAHLLLDLASSNLPELSSLKGLGLFTSTAEEASEWQIMRNILTRLALRIPVLQELLLCTFEKTNPGELDQLLPILGQLPRLRRLVIHEEHCIGQGREDIMQQFYERAKGLCPLLSTGDNRNPVLGLTLS